MGNQESKGSNFSEKSKNRRSKWEKVEIVGLILVITSLIILLFKPDSLSALFDKITKEVFSIVIPIFLTGEVGIAIIVSVILGRILERLGFTDALIRVFVPVMKILKINPSVIIPSIYNILGDINAAGKIAGPILTKAKATKGEQKIAIATMIQSPQSFVTFAIGLVALSLFKINSFPLIIISVFVPLIIMPFILSKTIYKDTRLVELEELPRFTPKTGVIETLFSSAREGAELLFLVIIPAVAAVFTVIGFLDYVGIWKSIEGGLSSILLTLNIEPKTGIVSILASPTLAMAQLTEIKDVLDPRLVVGSFVLANSGLPLSVIFGQIPATWADISDLNEKEALNAAIIGAVIRLTSAFLIALLLTPLIS